MFCKRVPAPFMGDDGLRFLPSFAHFGEVLMVVERVAAGPIDELDIGVERLGSVVVERFSWVEEHVADACDGYEGSDGIASLGEGGDGSV